MHPFNGSSDVGSIPEPFESKHDVDSELDV